MLSASAQAGTADVTDDVYMAVVGTFPEINARYGDVGGTAVGDFYYVTLLTRNEDGTLGFGSTRIGFEGMPSTRRSSPSRARMTR